MKLPPLYHTTGKMIRVIQSCETLAQLGCAVRWCTKVCQMYPITEESLWCAQEVIKAIEQHQYKVRYTGAPWDSVRKAKEMLVGSTYARYHKLHPLEVS